jgi:hypothetical protein
MEPRYGAEWSGVFLWFCHYPFSDRMTLSVQRFAMGWTIRCFNNGGGGGKKLSLLHTLSDRPWGPPSLLYNWYCVSFPGAKQLGRGADHLPPSSARVKNGKAVPLTFVSAWHFKGRPITLPLPLPIHSGTSDLRLRQLPLSIPGQRRHESDTQWCRVLEKLIVSRSVKAFSTCFCALNPYRARNNQPLTTFLAS